MVLHIINQGFERAYGAVAKVTLTSVNICRCDKYGCEVSSVLASVNIISSIANWSAVEIIATQPCRRV